MTAERSAQPLLRMEHITKRYPGVLANDDVTIEVYAGEVLGLLGENGAGKSTLMKVLYGLESPDSGRVLIDGVPIDARSPHDAIAAGIGMVHQHFMLVPTLTVAENVALGMKSPALRPLRLGQVRDRVAELSANYGLGVDPDAMVWQLAVGERQRVEILKVLFRDVKVLALDEPTAVLTPTEVDDLLRILRRMTDDGRGLIFISHKLHEVLDFTDRITVLRDGAIVGDADPSSATRQDLAQLMVGRPVKLLPERSEMDAGPPLLSIKGLRVGGHRRTWAVDDVTLDVHAGEILGVAGVSGNGQRELADAITGLRAVSSGTVEVNGVDTTGGTPREVRNAGLAYVPEERMREGTIVDFTVWENSILLDHSKEPYCSNGLLRMAPIRAHAQSLVDSYAVKTPGIDALVRTLSGGNIQKLVMGRELTSTDGVLVVSQPTRGVDIGAAEYIHERLIEVRTAGAAVLLFSEDLDELLGLSDRIAVMFEGRVVGLMDRNDCSLERIGMLMAGAG